MASYPNAFHGIRLHKVTDSGDVRALDVKVGDTVYFGKYSGTEIKVDGEELLIMREDDIIAVVE